MKLLILFLGIAIGTGFGLYTRPSFFMIGQLNWLNVLTKGYFVGSFEGFFSQGMLDESFYHVLKFQGIGVAGAILILILWTMLQKSKPAKKTKK